MRKLRVGSQVPIHLSEYGKYNFEKAYIRKGYWIMGVITFAAIFIGFFVLAYLAIEESRMMSQMY